MKIPLHVDQADASLRQAWANQDEQCPTCGESHPWHCGVLVANGTQRVWQCLLCSLLASAQKNVPKHVSEPWEELRDHVPVPSGYRLVWVNSEWVPPTPGFTISDPLHLARLLGRAPARRMWAALHEDTRVVSRKPWTPDEGSAVPFLLRELESKNLSAYLCSPEELLTRDYIHLCIGFDESQFEWSEFLVDGLPLQLPYIPPAIVEQIQRQTPKQRRANLPRIGVVDPEHWQDTLNSGQQPLGTHVKTLLTDDGWRVYFASIQDCTYLYDASGKNGLLQPYANMAGMVGYDFAALADPETPVDALLWARVFGDELVR